MRSLCRSCHVCCGSMVGALNMVQAMNTMPQSWWLIAGMSYPYAFTMLLEDESLQNWVIYMVNVGKYSSTMVRIWEYVLPSGNQTWQWSPYWMEVLLGRSLISMVPFPSPCLITRGYFYLHSFVMPLGNDSPTQCGPPIMHWFIHPLFKVINKPLL